MHWPAFGLKRLKTKSPTLGMPKAPNSRPKIQININMKAAHLGIGISSQDAQAHFVSGLVIVQGCDQVSGPLYDLIIQPYNDVACPRAPTSPAAHQD
jgi:hypothetical protein